MAEEIFELKLTRTELVVLRILVEHAVKLKRTERDLEIGSDLLARLNYMLWPGYWKEQESRRRDQAG